MIKLNLGCGNDRKPSAEGWINVDIRPDVKPDLLHDVRKALPYPDQSCSEIQAKDVLEHVPWREIPAVLKDWLRVLAPGSRIYIQCPNLGRLAGQILTSELWKWDQVSYWIYGEQNYPDNTHRAGFTIMGLAALLRETGFQVISCESDGGSNIMAWAVRP